MEFAMSKKRKGLRPHNFVRWNECVSGRDCDMACNPARSASVRIVVKPERARAISAGRGRGFSPPEQVNAFCLLKDFRRVAPAMTSSPPNSSQAWHATALTFWLSLSAITCFYPV